MAAAVRGAQRAVSADPTDETAVSGLVTTAVLQKDLVALESENAKSEADSRAYALEKTLAALASSDPEVVKALAQVGLDPDRLVAAAMQEFAANAEKIGELNLSPKLLRELLDR